MQGDSTQLQQRLFKVLHFSNWAVDRTTLTWTYLVKYDGEVAVTECRIPSDFAKLTPLAQATLTELLDANAPVEALLEVFGG